VYFLLSIYLQKINSFMPLTNIVVKRRNNLLAL
jgi:hypothetical protein